MDSKKAELRLLAERLRHIESSPTLALAAKAKALAKAGNPVLDFTAGEPDFPTPAHIKRAAIASLDADRTRYTPVAGIPELRSAIADTTNRRLGTRYAASQVIVSCGAKHSLYNIFQTLCQPGDEVIVFAPYWVSYPPLVTLAGATPVIVETDEADGFLPDAHRLAAALTARTKAIVLNSPSNPTGAVMTAAHLRAIATIAAERDLIVITDEIYDQLVYPPAVHRSIISVAPEIAEQAVLVCGVSKTYSMTGWRIGWAIAPQPWADGMINLQSHATSNPASISQDAALAALTGDQTAVAHMRAEFQKRRDRLVQGLNAIAPLRCAMPGGAFYAWCNVSGLGASADAVAARWLEQSFVAVVPGEGFGAPQHVRFSFATSLQTIEEGLTRLGHLATRPRGR